jgi:hypothetical protein
MESKLTQEYVKQLFDYHEDGYLIWKIDKGSAKKGDVVGCISESRGGYIVTRVDNRIYLIQNIIWLYHGNKLNKKNYMVDHRDRNRINNRIENLRYISHSNNMMNTGLRVNNTSGITGVNFNKYKGWQARIGAAARCFLGSYESKEEAIFARYTAEVFNGIDQSYNTPAYLYLKENNLI